MYFYQMNKDSIIIMYNFVYYLRTKSVPGPTLKKIAFDMYGSSYFQFVSSK